MKNRISTNIIAYTLTLITLLLAIFSWNSVVYAAPNSSVSSVITKNGEANLGKGNASITIAANDGQSLIGKDFVIYQLFHAENSVNGESINYTFVDESKSALQNAVGDKINKIATEVTEYEVIDYIQSLNNFEVEGSQTEQNENGYYSEFRYFVETIRTELEHLGSTAAHSVRITDVKEDGSVKLNGLAYGYYIIDEVSNTEGTFSASSLCMVTTINPDSTIKIKSDYPTVTKKIQEDDNRVSIANDGWNDMADYEIGQNIPFKHTSKIINMNGYDTYYFAWHDVMDEELTFDPTSVKITISEGDKEYILTNNEFTVNENVNGETFVVAVSDLKKLVDDNFNHVDELGHNTYGQTVILEYTAKLNDKAASNLNKNGFENDVRVEFSNDPDSTGIGKTGFTPWDTVVCFTYRLNGLKVNNYNLKLADAKFRLYSDEKCENEVYVKKLNDTYSVINRDSCKNEVPSDAVEMVSNKDGTFVISGLDSGVYYLKETDAPSGYRVIQDPICIKIEAAFIENRNSYVKGNGASALTDLKYTADVKQFLDGAFRESSENLVVDMDHTAGNLIVVNTVGTKLPVTGSFATIVMLGIGTTMMLATLKGKRKRDV